MSRTDAHVPVYVRLHYGDLGARADHALDHRVCDLPARPPLRGDGWRESRCTWSTRYTGINVCSCFLCHAGAEARRTNRLERQRDRRRIAEALHAWRGGDETSFDGLGAPVALRGFW